MAVLFFIPSPVLQAAARSTKGIPRLSSGERALIKIPGEVKDILIVILFKIFKLLYVVILGVVLCFLLYIFYFNILENIGDLTTSFMSTPLLNPLLVYNDLKSDKKSILSDNKGKAGIYMWTNLVNGKRYVGSSVDLSIRFRKYFSTSYLEDFEGIMLIYKALLAHGLENFKLEILEYCQASEVIEREQYYMDLLNPEYNILKVAASPLGVKRKK